MDKDGEQPQKGLLEEEFGWRVPMNYSYQKFISDKLDIEFIRESINRARFSIAFQWKSL